jgi:hypothetical protein
MAMLISPPTRVRTETITGVISATSSLLYRQARTNPVMREDLARDLSQSTSNNTKLIFDQPNRTVTKNIKNVNQFQKL